MKLQLYGLNLPMSAALNSHAERRFHSAPARILQRIGLVVVRVADLNGPRGGLDKRCDVRVQVVGGPTVTIRETDRCLYRAIDRAAGRVERIATKTLRRQRANRRRRPRRHFGVSNTPRSAVTGEPGDARR